MSVIKKIKKLSLSHMFLAITFFTSGLMINFFQLVLHLFLKPFNKTLYRSINYYLCYFLYSQILFVSEWWANSTAIVWMDEDDRKKYLGKEHVLLILNHTYEIDWLAGWQYADKCHVLGNCKAYAKKVIAYMPIVGWTWNFAEFIFLERSYDKDKEVITRQIEEIYTYPDPVWLTLVPEGTRFTPEKHEVCVKFANDNGLPALKYHLIPRTKGFTASLPSLRNKCAIYDINIAFRKDDKVEPTLSNLFNGDGVQAFIYMRRIPLDNVPEDEAEAALWLHALFREKDRIQDSFHTTGSFFKTSGIKETNSITVEPRLETLVNFVIWSILSFSIILYYLLPFLCTRSWFGFSIAVGILVTFFVLMESIIDMSKVSQGSSYGAEMKKNKKVIL